MNDLFIQFGVQAGGGPAFLKRTRTAYSYNQLQRQNSSGVTYSQLQRRDGTGFTYTDSGCEFLCTDYYPIYNGFSYAPGDCNAGTWDGQNPFGYGCSWSQYGYAACDKLYWSSRASQCQALNDGSQFTGCSNGAVRQSYSYQGGQCAFCCEYKREVGSTYSRPECGISWGGWYNVGSCSTVSPSCSNGATYVGCQTATLCYWNVTQSWYNVTSCSASTPSCTNGASRVECRTLTLYDWNPWSEYEEVDICVPQSPAAGAGAVQIECVPQ
jgi:hypothetical protein